MTLQCASSLYLKTTIMVKDLNGSKFSSISTQSFITWPISWVAAFNFIWQHGSRQRWPATLSLLVLNVRICRSI